jgi:hypothetical protein
MLIAFFLIFCAIVAAAGIAGWRNYAQAMERVDGAMVRAHAPAGVTYQAKGKPTQEKPNARCNDNLDSSTCQILSEGDRVQAVPDAGYGPVASITLPDKTRIVDLYAYPTGADLTLKTFQVSRWSRQRQVLVFAQTSGYARYDIPSKSEELYEDVTYTVEITKGVQVELAPGGSYSINVPHAIKDHPLPLAASGKPILVEVAVRAGSAEVQTEHGSVRAQPGWKIGVDSDKVAGEPLPARWELIRDANFEQHGTGNAPAGLDAWVEVKEPFDPTATAAEQNGQFSVHLDCRPENPGFCKPDESDWIGQFHRDGDQQKSYIVGVKQNLDVDVSEYRSLRFSMWARVIRQTIPQAGIANIECPITVKFTFRKDSPNSTEEQRYICVYQKDTDQPIQNADKLGEWSYQGVPQNSWYHLTAELRDPRLLPDARYVKEIKIYANGHDYISEVTGVSLTASQHR